MAYWLPNDLKAFPQHHHRSRPSTVAPALWAVWAKELAGHFAGHPTPYHTPEDTLARAWLLYWTRQQQQEKAGGTVAVAVEGGHEEQATPLLKQEEGGMEGILDEAGWAELEKMELAALVTPGSPRHRPGFANRDDPDPLPHVVAPAFHAPGSLLPLGADIAPLVFDEAAMGMEIDDPRVPALQSELAACKAQLAAAEQRLAQLEMAHAQLLAWLAAWASATSGQEGGVVGSA